MGELDIPEDYHSKLDELIARKDFSDVLFSRDDFDPMEFCFSTAKTVEEGRILKKFKILVEMCGGIITFNFSAGGLHLIKFVHSKRLSFRNEDYFLSRYILDCADQNKLLDLGLYRASKTRFPHIRPSEIALGIKSWEDARASRCSSGGEEVSDDFSEDEEVVPGTSKTTSKTSERRKYYTVDEERDILNFILKRKYYLKVKGNSIWQRMENEKVCGIRTWQSMKERYLHHIIPRLKQFKLDPLVEAKLLKPFRNDAQSFEEELPDCATVLDGKNCTEVLPIGSRNSIVTAACERKDDAISDCRKDEFDIVVDAALAYTLTQETVRDDEIMVDFEAKEEPIASEELSEEKGSIEEYIKNEPIEEESDSNNANDLALNESTEEYAINKHDEESSINILLTEVITAGWERKEEDAISDCRKDEREIMVNVTSACLFPQENTNGDEIIAHFEVKEDLTAGEFFFSRKRSNEEHIKEEIIEEPEEEYVTDKHEESDIGKLEKSSATVELDEEFVVDNPLEDSAVDELREESNLDKLNEDITKNEFNIGTLNEESDINKPNKDSAKDESREVSDIYKLNKESGIDKSNEDSTKDESYDKSKISIELISFEATNTTIVEFVIPELHELEKETETTAGDPTADEPNEESAKDESDMYVDIIDTFETSEKCVEGPTADEPNKESTEDESDMYMDITEKSVEELVLPKFPVPVEETDMHIERPSINDGEPIDHDAPVFPVACNLSENDYSCKEDFNITMENSMLGVLMNEAATYFDSESNIPRFSTEQEDPFSIVDSFHQSKAQKNLQSTPVKQTNCEAGVSRNSTESEDSTHSLRLLASHNSLTEARVLPVNMMIIEEKDINQVKNSEDDLVSIWDTSLIGSENDNQRIVISPSEFLKESPTINDTGQTKELPIVLPESDTGQKASASRVLNFGMGQQDSLAAPITDTGQKDSKTLMVSECIDSSSPLVQELNSEENGKSEANNSKMDPVSSVLPEPDSKIEQLRLGTDQRDLQSSVEPESNEAPLIVSGSASKEGKPISYGETQPFDIQICEAFDDKLCKNVVVNLGKRVTCNSNNVPAAKTSKKLSSTKPPEILYSVNIESDLEFNDSDSSEIETAASVSSVETIIFSQVAEDNISLGINNASSHKEIADDLSDVEIPLLIKRGTWNVKSQASNKDSEDVPVVALTLGHDSGEEKGQSAKNLLNNNNNSFSNTSISREVHKPNNVEKTKFINALELKVKQKKNCENKSSQSESRTYNSLALNRTRNRRLRLQTTSSDSESESEKEVEERVKVKENRKLGFESSFSAVGNRTRLERKKILVIESSSESESRSEGQRESCKAKVNHCEKFEKPEAATSLVINRKKITRHRESDKSAEDSSIPGALNYRLRTRNAKQTKAAAHESDYDSDYSVTSTSSRLKYYLEKDDIEILKYIYKNRLFEAVRGKTMWEDMEKRKILPGRTWHSLKERFRKRILPRIKSYKKLSAKVIESFLECGRDDGFRPLAIKYSSLEDSNILDFIIKYKRYKEIKGKAMWVSMSKFKNLDDRSWESLKNRFLHVIAPNLHLYNISDEARSNFEKILNNNNNHDTNNSRGQKYSEEEDMSILDFIIRYKRFREIKGKVMWVSMAENFEKRTWESLKNRFLQTIIPNLKSYNIDDKARKSIESVFKRPNRKPLFKMLEKLEKNRTPSRSQNPTSRENTETANRKRRKRNSNSSSSEGSSFLSEDSEYSIEDVSEAENEGSKHDGETSEPGDDNEIYPSTEDEKLSQGKKKASVLKLEETLLISKERANESDKDIQERNEKNESPEGTIPSGQAEVDLSEQDDMDFSSPSKTLILRRKLFTTNRMFVQLYEKTPIDDQSDRKKTMWPTQASLAKKNIFVNNKFIESGQLCVKNNSNETIVPESRESNIESENKSNTTIDSNLSESNAPFIEPNTESQNACMDESSKESESRILGIETRNLPESINAVHNPEPLQPVKTPLRITRKSFQLKTVPLLHEKNSNLKARNAHSEERKSSLSCSKSTASAVPLLHEKNSNLKARNAHSEERKASLSCSKSTASAMPLLHEKNSNLQARNAHSEERKASLSCSKSTASAVPLLHEKNSNLQARNAHSEERKSSISCGKSTASATSSLVRSSRNRNLSSESPKPSSKKRSLESPVPLCEAPVDQSTSKCKRRLSTPYAYEIYPQSSPNRKSERTKPTDVSRFVNEPASAGLFVNFDKQKSPGPSLSTKKSTEPSPKLTLSRTRRSPRLNKTSLKERLRKRQIKKVLKL